MATYWKPVPIKNELGQTTDYKYIEAMQPVKDFLEARKKGGKEFQRFQKEK